jgi:hydrogenase maturation protein HypF
MAENGLDERVIGVAFDGTGFGTDGEIWGSEFLLCDYRGFERAAHFRYVPLVGGERAIRQPWRAAATHLIDAFGPAWQDLETPLWSAADDKTWRTFERLYYLKAQRTSSCGRLFDAVSALTGCCQDNSYEGEAAMLLEATRDFRAPAERLPIGIDATTSPWTIDTRPLIRSMAERIAAGAPASVISGDFHETVAQTVSDVATRLRKDTKINTVCLSGGTFQNAFLLERATHLLAEAGFRVFSHSRVPTNDGGIALGQVAILARLLRDNE